MTTDPLLLAIDGGSTKTDAVLVAADGSVLGRARTGPSNHQLVGVDGAVDAIGEAIAVALGDAGISEPAFPICELGVYCLAGLDLPVDDARMAPTIALRGWTATDLLRNDTFAVSRAGTTKAWGIGLVCGTGMNCAGVGPDGSVVRFPALAELSGDFAPGGSWLGIRALGLALRARDGRGQSTTLSELIPQYFDQPDVESVLSAIYTGDISYGRLFELARLLLDAAATGDEPSRGAADLLADEVVAFATAAITRLNVTDEAFEIVLGGGIFQTHDAGFHQRVADGIHRVAPHAVLQHLSAPPVLGAALIGLDTLHAPDAAKARLRTELSIDNPPID